MPTVNNSTLVDTCYFPSVRFGSYYTSVLATNTISGDTVTVPDDVFVSMDTLEVTNDLTSGLRSVTAQTSHAVTSDADEKRTNINFTKTTTGATVTSNFGGVASNINVTDTPGNITVAGKSC